MATGNIDTGDSNDQCSPSTSALTHQPQNLRVMSSRASTISVGSTTSLLPKLRYALMAEYLQQIQIQRRWIANPESEAEGAFVRLNQGGYATVPSRHMEDSTMLYEAVAALNASVSFVSLCHSRLLFSSLSTYIPVNHFTYPRSNISLDSPHSVLAADISLSLSTSRRCYRTRLSRPSYSGRIVIHRAQMRADTSIRRVCYLRTPTCRMGR